MFYTWYKSNTHFIPYKTTNIICNTQTASAICHKIHRRKTWFESPLYKLHYSWVFLWVIQSCSIFLGLFFPQMSKKEKRQGPCDPFVKCFMTPNHRYAMAIRCRRHNSTLSHPILEKQKAISTTCHHPHKQHVHSIESPKCMVIRGCQITGVIVSTPCQGVIFSATSHPSYQWPNYSCLRWEVRNLPRCSSFSHLITP